MRRQKLEYSLLSLIAMIVILGSLNLCTAQAKDKINIKVDYVAKLNEIGKVGRAKNLNAAPYYEKAFELSVELPEHLSKSDRKGWPKDLSSEKQILLQEWVFANSEALEQLKLGTEKPFYWAEYRGSSMLGIAMPDLAKARSLMYALCARAKLNATKDNLKVAFSDLLVCYRFGAHFTGSRVLIEQLVGIALRAYVVQSAFEILDKKNPNTDLLKYFQQEFETILLRGAFVIDFTAEKLAMYDNIQRIFTDDGRGGGHIYGTKPGESPAYFKQLLGIEMTAEQKRKLEKLDRRQTTEITDKVFEYLGRAARKTPWQLHSEGKGIKEVIQEMTKTNPLLNILTPAFARVLEVSSRGKAETDALITTVAILRYKADNGKLPLHLQELVSAGYLSELPMDPFGPGPLTYTRVTKDNFTLYSFGADFDDDGGVRSKWGLGEQGGDQVFWPVSRKQK